MRLRASLFARAALIAALLFLLASIPLAVGGSPDEPPDRPTGLTGTVAHDQVALTWDSPPPPRS